MREIAAAMAAHRDRWGITRYAIREPHLDTANEVLAHLSHAARRPAG